VAELERWFPLAELERWFPLAALEPETLSLAA
jgi:hypothetical protein